jgi:3,4-dihydroxy 2-butanone 4-phosphate synthase/GTP cyclohydrolase II
MSKEVQGAQSKGNKKARIAMPRAPCSLLVLALLLAAEQTIGYSISAAARAPVAVHRARALSAVLSSQPPQSIPDGNGRDGLQQEETQQESQRQQLQQQAIPVRRVAERASTQGVAVPPPEASSQDGHVFGPESVERAVEAMRNGSIVLLTEDGDERTSGQLVVSPELVDADQLRFLLEHGTRIHANLEPSRYRAIYRSLHKIVLDNNNLAQPALSVSARGEGRSPRNADDIASAMRALMQTDWSVQEEALRAEEDASGEPSLSSPASPDAARGIEASTSALVCPGAVSLACCREGGVLRRAGATEASVELAKLAGLLPVGLSAAIPSRNLDSLRAFAGKWGIPVSSTADLVAYVRRREMLVERCGPPAQMPTRYGRFVAHTYRSRIDGTEHIALVKARAEGDAGAGGAGGVSSMPDAISADAADAAALRPFAGSSRSALVRVHSECCTGDVFGSLRCDCGPQLEKALEMIEQDGWGVLLYLRGQEGRGIGLGAKMHAYALQERGVDTMDANLQLGLPVDSREYGTGAQILADLGITGMRLMSNNPKKFTGLAGYGLTIVERVPSITAPNPENIRYLQTKVERMGHLLEVDVSGGDGGGGGGEVGSEVDDGAEWAADP